jgi:hypothetical protein
MTTPRCPLTTHIQVFEALERVYSMPNKEYLYQSQFERLELGNTEFNAFVAEFYRLAAPRRKLAIKFLPPEAVPDDAASHHWPSKRIS